MIFNAGVSGSSGGKAGFRSVETTLLSSDWEDNRIVLTSATIKENSGGSVNISQTATATQYFAWMYSLPQVVDQASGSITIEAHGEIPDVDIPVLLEVAV